MGIRVLVVEDEDEIADFLVRGLREEGFAVERAADGPDGWHRLRAAGWDAVVLDWWLPGADGLSLLRRLRQAGDRTPVLMLTARDAVSDRVRGLDGGADAARAMPATAGGRLPVGPAADELADLGRAFNDLLDRLGEAHERQRRFTGGASHQLRTPLAAVLGQDEVALRRDRPPEEYRRVLESVRGQADRLRRLVESLLFLARAGDEAGLPGRERVDLPAWLPDHLQGWSDHPRGADLKYEIAAGPVWVEAHPVLLGELLDNLIDNASRYSRPGTPVTLRLGRDVGGAWVEVADRGCGIPPGEQGELFRPFFRSAEARRLGSPGVGLGLAVALRLARAFGGSVRVGSEAGVGSTFRVRVPAAE